MLGIFRAKPILSEEGINFQIATYRWSLKNFGGEAFLKKQSLSCQREIEGSTS